MRLKTAVVVAGCAAILAGCKTKTADNTSNYANAINTYYAPKPACLWSEPKKFPAQADTSDTAQTSGYDALVDQGLLTRTTDEKKRFLIGSKQVTNYDISDQGRGAWKPDPHQPGFGNFCYGTPVVATIDSSTPTNGLPGATTVVNYHSKLSSVPGWASATETQTAFPQVQAALAAPVPNTVTLTDTDHGWVVTTGPKGTTSADGSIVQ